MAPGWIQIALVAGLALLLFGGRGRVAAFMEDLAKGMKAFRRGLKEDSETGVKEEQPPSGKKAATPESEAGEKSN